jgi:hypothetical protein
LRLWGNRNVTEQSQCRVELSSTSTGLALDSSGAVNLARGATVGSETLTYRICEVADPANCDDATVTVTVLPPYVIDAVSDSAI